MPAPAHYRITFSGTLGPAGAASEIWACNVSASPGGSPFLVRTDLPALATALKGPFVTNLLPKCSNTVALTRVRVAVVDETGHVQREASGAYIQADDTAPAYGSGTTYVPYQIALAMGLYSSMSGPTGRGRFYLPMPVPGTIANDGKIPTSTRDAFATSLKACVDGWNTALAARTAGSRIVVASGGSPTKGIAPGLRPVTHVAVGRVLDVQRRRREELAEEPILTALA